MPREVKLQSGIVIYKTGAGREISKSMDDSNRSRETTLIF